MKGGTSSSNSISYEENYAAYLAKYPILKQKESIEREYEECKAAKNDLERQKDSSRGTLICASMVLGVIVPVTFGSFCTITPEWEFVLMLLPAIILTINYKTNFSEKEEFLRKEFSRKEAVLNKLQSVPKFDKTYNYRDGCKIITNSTVNELAKHSPQNSSIRDVALIDADDITPYWVPNDCYEKDN